MKKVLPPTLLLALALCLAGCESTNDRGVIVDHGVWPFGANTPQKAPLLPMGNSPDVKPEPATT